MPSVTVKLHPALKAKIATVRPGTEDDPVWDWLNSNSAVLSLFVSLGTLLVWLFYLQLFLLGYRRRRRSKILINVGGQGALESRCLVCNMSEEPIYLLSLTAAATTTAGTWRRAITDYELDENAPTPKEPGQMTRQGPLHVGDCRDVGSFSDLVERARHARGDWEPAESLEHDRWPTELKLIVVAIYGSEDLPVAAERRFKLTGEDGTPCAAPLTADTLQVRRKSERRKLYRNLAEYL